MLGTELSTFHKTSSFNSHNHLIPLVAVLKISSKVTSSVPEALSQSRESSVWGKCLVSVQ